MQFISKLFADQIGEVDEKRVAGVISWFAGFLVALIGGILAIIFDPDKLTPVLTLAAALAGFGALGLAGAAVADQGRLGKSGTGTAIVLDGQTVDGVRIQPPTPGQGE